MASTEIKRVDDLGRVQIPKFMRKQLEIYNGDSLEVQIKDGGIYLKLYKERNEENSK